MRRFVVMIEASPAALLVAADDELDFALRPEALVFQSFEAPERRHGGTLVVHGAAPPDLDARNAARGKFVVDGRAERRESPSAARGHHVEMRENGKFFALSEDHFSDVIIVVVRFKTHFGGEGKEIAEAIRRFLPERAVPFRGL